MSIYVFTMSNSSGWLPPFYLPPNVDYIQKFKNKAKISPHVSTGLENLLMWFASTYLMMILTMLLCIELISLPFSRASQANQIFGALLTELQKLQVPDFPPGTPVYLNDWSMFLNLLRHYLQTHRSPLKGSQQSCSLPCQQTRSHSGSKMIIQRVDKACTVCAFLSAHC